MKELLSALQAKSESLFGCNGFMVTFGGRTDIRISLVVCIVYSV